MQVLWEESRDVEIKVPCLRKEMFGMWPAEPYRSEPYHTYIDSSSGVERLKSEAPREAKLVVENHATTGMDASSSSWMMRLAWFPSSAAGPVKA